MQQVMQCNSRSATVSDENKPVVSSRGRKAVVNSATGDDARVELIRNGEWRKVLHDVGPEEYNRLRLVALR